VYIADWSSRNGLTKNPAWDALILAPLAFITILFAAWFVCPAIVPIAIDPVPWLVKPAVFPIAIAFPFWLYTPALVPIAIEFVFDLFDLRYIQLK